MKNSFLLNLIKIRLSTDLNELMSFPAAQTPYSPRDVLPTMAIPLIIYKERTVWLQKKFQMF